jgi:hypothetical protein
MYNLSHESIYIFYWYQGASVVVHVHIHPVNHLFSNYFTKLKTKASQHNLLQNCKNLMTNILQGIATLVPMQPTIIKFISIVYTKCPRYYSTCHWGHKYAHVIFYSKKEKKQVYGGKYMWQYFTLGARSALHLGIRDACVFFLPKPKIALYPRCHTR